MLKEIAHLLTSPINQTILVLFVCALLNWKTQISKTLIRASALISLMWLYLCSQPFFSHALMAPIENQFKPVLAQDKTWQDADLIWVLACNHYNRPELPDVSRWNTCSLQRLIHTYQMYKNKPTRIVVTGGNFSKDSSFHYATQAKQFLINLGVPTKMILAVNEGTNTKEELLSLLKQEAALTSKKLAIVSSASHGRRIQKLIVKYSELNYIYIPVEHLNASYSRLDIGLPKIRSIEKSQRAIYTYIANLEVALFD